MGDEAMDIGEWLAQQRPALFRYCSRMTGSVIDGEDAVQDTCLKAVQSFPGFEVLTDPKAWLFRVAYNASMDLLRARSRAPEPMAEEVLEALADPVSSGEARWIAGSALRHFMWLTAAERSCVILMDVLGYTLQEVSEITGRSILSVKAALHRGRTRLREIADTAETVERAPLDAGDQLLLELYTQRFNQRDFDGVRAMLGEEVRLDLVGRAKLRGKPEVGSYLRRYSEIQDWVFAPGVIEGRPAAIAYEPDHPGGSALYFVLLRFENGHVQDIRDFRYARYAAESVQLTIIRSDSRSNFRTGSHPTH